MAKDCCGTNVGENPNTPEYPGGGDNGDGSNSGGWGDGSGFATSGPSSDWYNPPRHRDRIQLVYQGDEMVGYFQVKAPNGTPVTPQDSQVVFTLTDQRFDLTSEVLWVGTWANGIEAVPNTDSVVKVTIPKVFSDNARRGSFLYGITVADPLGDHKRTIYEGYLLVEYAAGAPNPDIPYRHSIAGDNLQNSPLDVDYSPPNP